MKHLNCTLAVLLLFCTFGKFVLTEPTGETTDETTTEEITTEELTTPEIITTPEPPTTTKATTTTTSKPTTTPTLPPSNDAYVYNVTENNVTCIMVDADFNFLVTYNIGGNLTNQSTIHVPTPKDKIHVMVDGSCNSSEKGYEGTQYIKLVWGDSVPQNSVKLRFNQSSDGKTWHLFKFSSVLNLDKDEFQNATDGGKSLSSIMKFELTPSDIPANHSFLCYAKFEVTNVTTLIENLPYKYPVTLNVGGIQLEAYNQVHHENKFVDEVHCEADKIADIVPIAVGCALAALIIIVLIAYIVGRRRRSAAYQSV